MIEFTIGLKCRYAGLLVTIHSLLRDDGRYIVEDSTGAFFPAHRAKLSLLKVAIERTDLAASFQSIASRAAMFGGGRVKQKSKQR